jgi:hypothetical protein
MSKLDQEPVQKYSVPALIESLDNFIELMEEEETFAYNRDPLSGYTRLCEQRLEALKNARSLF